MIFNRLYATVDKKLNEMTDDLILSVFYIFKLELQTGIICTTVNSWDKTDFSWSRKVAAINTIFAARVANYCYCYNVHCSLICFLVLSVLLMCCFSRKNLCRPLCISIKPQTGTKRQLEAVEACEDTKPELTIKDDGEVETKRAKLSGKDSTTKLSVKPEKGTLYLIMISSAFVPSLKS